MSILNLHQVRLVVANQVILEQASWQMAKRERIALVGRNGAGKSTFLKLLQGELLPDSGQVQMIQGLRIAGLTQDVPYEGHESVYHFLVKGLGEVGEIMARLRVLSARADDLDALAECQQHLEQHHGWALLPRAETLASRLGIPLDEEMKNLSGGMKRRVLLAAALMTEPDLLLLDEPTNHLDITAIEWLESYLQQYTGSVLLVTHDRDFLQKVSNCIVEIDRGQLYRYEGRYDSYLDRREAMRLSETRDNALFDKRLAQEEAWIRTGVKARRTRNEGRVRALKAMRAAYQARRQAQGTMQTMAMDVTQSGQIVVEAQHMDYQLPDKNALLIKDFSCLVLRGDKIGIVGPNGCGKTTLVRLLLGELPVHTGKIRLGSGIEVAYFDQLRRQLDETQTVMANVADGADYVSIQGQSKHVASYLREFLFTPEQFQRAVGTLSGGEKNRLLLAKILAKPVNLLVLDEPTNDLDLETLELLESVLVNYAGTLIVISHDRAFINNVVTSVWVYEEGRFNAYVGGYDDYLRVKSSSQIAVKQSKTTSPAPSSPVITDKTSAGRPKLSYNEQKELAKLPLQIEALEQAIEAKHKDMSAQDFYQKPAEQLVAFNQALAEQERVLKQYYQRWEALEDKKG